MRRGFTLVELMIVIAIVGVVAALAVYGVNLYLANSKASEAKNMVGAISRGATAAYVRARENSEAPGEGAQSGALAHALCDTANPVPGAVPPGRKYQPNTSDGFDFSAGDVTTGWKCIKFETTQPIYYQYHYTKEGSPAAPANPGSCATNCYEAGAVGDLDGDGNFSRFARTGQINTATGTLAAATTVFEERPTE